LYGDISEKNPNFMKGFLSTKSLSLSLFGSTASLGLGLLRNLLPLKMAEFLGGFSTIFFFTG
jgi:hypothetical protein